MRVFCTQQDRQKLNDTQDTTVHKNSGIFILNHNGLFLLGNYLSVERQYPPHEAIGVPELLYGSVDDHMWTHVPNNHFGSAKNLRKAWVKPKTALGENTLKVDWELYLAAGGK